MIETLNTLKKAFLPDLAPEDFFILLGAATGYDTASLLAHPDTPLSRAATRRFRQFAKRRRAHEPVAYILGTKEFLGLPFLVTKDTLIPRPETELLVEYALQYIASIPNKHLIIIDVGTGSGNILLSLAHEQQKKLSHLSVQFLGVDISKDALRIARKNAKQLQLSESISFIHSDLLKKIPEKIFSTPSSIETQCLVLANLPYVSHSIFKTLSPDILNFEPKSALVSNAFGTDHTLRLLREIQKKKQSFPNIDFSLLFEMSPEQKNRFEDSFKKWLNKENFSFLKDYSGRIRFGELRNIS